MQHFLRACVRRRPVTSFTVATTAGLVSYAAVTEFQANEQTKRYQQHVAVSSVSASAVAAVDHNVAVADAVAVLPRRYDWDAVHTYWSHRPVTAITRMGEIVWHLTPLAVAYARDFWILPLAPALSDGAQQQQHQRLQQQHAAGLKEVLTVLGPAFVKAGQQISIRPDLVPAAVLKELQQLCDAVTPVPDEIALQTMRDELLAASDDSTLLDIFVETPVLVASASLGQVYKAQLKKSSSNKCTTVAIKVQRPDMLQRFSLDLYILQRIGVLVDSFTAVFTKQAPYHKGLYESFARGSYSELDYENEAANQILFKKELEARQCPVVIPAVFTEYTTRTVLTTEWIEGIKLADSPPEQIRELIPIGVELFLTQLLDIGHFHADPHVGNLLVQAETGKLCLIDFGLCCTVDESERKAMLAAIVHLLTRDYETLVKHDAVQLGFLPADFDTTTTVLPLLTKILTVALVDSKSSDLRKRRRKLGEISNELNEVFFQYPFSVPPFFALVTRGLGLLEGIALSGDPDFDLFEAAAPYARRRALKLLGRGAFGGISRRNTVSTGS